MRFSKYTVLVVLVLVVSILLFRARYGEDEGVEGRAVSEGLSGVEARESEVAGGGSGDVGIPLDGLVSKAGNEGDGRKDRVGELAVRTEPVLDLGFELVADKEGGVRIGEHSHLAGQWKGRFSPLVDAGLLGEEGIGRRIGIVLPERERLVVRIDEHRVHGESRGVYVGKLEGEAKGSVLLSYAGRSVSGSVQNYVTGETWEIRNAGGGEQYLAIVDLDSLGSCGVCSPNK